MRRWHGLRSSRAAARRWRGDAVGVTCAGSFVVAHEAAGVAGGEVGCISDGWEPRREVELPHVQRVLRSVHVCHETRVTPPLLDETIHCRLDVWVAQRAHEGFDALIAENVLQAATIVHGLRIREERNDAGRKATAA